MLGQTWDALVLLLLLLLLPSLESDFPLFLVELLVPPVMPLVGVG